MHLDHDVVSFLTSPVSITVASRDNAMLPSVARAKGCTVRRSEVDSGGSRIRILLSASQAEQLLRDVATTHTISATFSLPRTHRTLQFKGTDARVTALEPADTAAIASYVDAFVNMIAHLGYSKEFVQAFLGSPADEVAVEFTPSDSFLQTPGPRAGSRL